MPSHFNENILYLNHWQLKEENKGIQSIITLLSSSDKILAEEYAQQKP